MKNILNLAAIEQIKQITKRMYELGWDERNGGNISVLIDEQELNEYIDTNNVIREIPFDFDAKELANKIFLVTATGSYFRKIIESPEELLGIFRISPNGDKALLLWGYKNNNRFTSELPTHMLVHSSRIKVDPNHKVVMHCHPVNLLIMTHIHELEDKSFTLSLWRTMTESIVVFPEGVGALPWMQSGTAEIGYATANKMQTFRLVIWGLHGIHAVGNTIDDAFGLIEVAEKSAQIYMGIQNHPAINSINNAQLLNIAQFYKLKNVNYKFLE